jgi:hypothetical protein
MFRYSSFGTTVVSDFELPELKTGASHGEPLRIRRGDFELPPLEAVDCRRQGRQAQYGASGKKDVLHWEGMGAFCVEDGVSILYATRSEDPALFRLYLLSEALGMALFQRGRFLLHGSAVEVNGKALIFLGTPGAGKSTTAASFHQLGCRALADDMVVLDTSAEGEVHLFPSYPQIKIWEPSVKGLGMENENLVPLFKGSKKWTVNANGTEPAYPGEIPVSDIFVISPQSKEMEYPKMNEQEAFLALTQYFPLPPQLLRGEKLERHFGQAGKIADRVNFWQLRRTHDFSDLKRFAEKIIEEKMTQNIVV